VKFDHPDISVKAAPCPEVDRFTQAAFLPFMKTTLTADQFSQCESLEGLSILHRYCSLFRDWRDTLIQKLSNDWADGTLKSPLGDMSLSASYLVVMNYPPASTAGETSYDCSTTNVIAEIFKLDFIYVDLVPVIPSQNKKKDNQMIKYAKDPEIAKNYRERLLCIVELQKLIGVTPTLLIGGSAAETAICKISHSIVIPHSGSTVWRLSALPSSAITYPLIDVRTECGTSLVAQNVNASRLRYTEDCCCWCLN